MTRSTMPPDPEVFFREAGAGPAVVCLHANAGSSSQWRALMDLLAPRFHVLAADSHGAGKSPPWPGGRPLTLSDEADLLEPVFARAGESFVLVGHSYGAAIALVAAHRLRPRVRALALYEPTLFALVDAQQPSPNDADGIKRAVAHAEAALAAGDEDAAARWFIDFWMGEGAWGATPQARRPAIVASIRNIAGWGHALLAEPTPLAAFASLQVPVLLMTGGRSPASGGAAARVLRPVLPQCETVHFPELGHMGPVTHPEVVNAAIQGFLERLGARLEA